MNSRTWPLLLAIVGGGGVGAGWWALGAGESGAVPSGVLAASGRLEGRSVRVASEAGGRVSELRVERGQDVAEGQVVAVLDSRTLRTAVAGAQAAVAAAEAAVVAAGDRVVALEAQVTLAATEADRYRRLFERDAVSRQVVDRAEAQQASLQGEMQAARAARVLARSEADVARATLRAAELQLDEATIRSPAAGQVTALLVRAGETVAPGMPVVTVLTTDPMRLRVYLPLLAAGRVQPGSEARVFVGAYPAEVFAGTVDRIAREAEFTPKDIHMPEERSTLVFAVEIRAANPDGKLKDGFPADAYIRWDPNVPWPDRPPW